MEGTVFSNIIGYQQGSDTNELPRSWQQNELAPYCSDLLLPGKAPCPLHWVAGRHTDNFHHPAQLTEESLGSHYGKL